VNEERMELERTEEILRADLPPMDQAARERARARLLARIEHEAPPRRRPRVVTIVGTAAAVIATLVVVQALLPPNRGGPHMSAAAELQGLGAQSAALPVAELAPDSYLYGRSELSGPIDYASAAAGRSYTLEVSSTRESWTAADGSGSTITTYHDVSFDSETDRDAWTAAGSPTIPEAGVQDVNDYGPGGLPVYPVERLPANPDELRQALEDGRVIKSAPGDANLLATMGTLMAQQTLPSDVRQAMFEVAAQIPGVAVNDASTDPLGRSAEAVSVADDSGTTTLFFDPVDASLLATSRTHPGSPATTAWQAYVASSVVNRIDQRVGE
jgi:hypothetical protein